MKHIETNGINNAVSCSKEAVQFNASFVTSQVASFFTKFVTANGLCIFIIMVTLIKIANTPLDLSAMLVLSVINPFAVTSYLVMRKLVAVCLYDEYTRPESHSSNA